MIIRSIKTRYGECKMGMDFLIQDALKGAKEDKFANIQVGKANIKERCSLQGIILHLQHKR